jgi:hypothetical protein
MSKPFRMLMLATSGAVLVTGSLLMAIGGEAIYGPAPNRAHSRRHSGRRPKGHCLPFLSWCERRIDLNHVSATGRTARRLFVSSPRLFQTSGLQRPLLFEICDDPDGSEIERPRHARPRQLFCGTDAPSNRCRREHRHLRQRRSAVPCRRSFTRCASMPGLSRHRCGGRKFGSRSICRISGTPRPIRPLRHSEADELSAGPSARHQQ